MKAIFGESKKKIEWLSIGWTADSFENPLELNVIGSNTINRMHYIRRSRSRSRSRRSRSRRSRSRRSRSRSRSRRSRSRNLFGGGLGVDDHVVEAAAGGDLERRGVDDVLDVEQVADDALDAGALELLVRRRVAEVQLRVARLQRLDRLAQAPHLSSPPPPQNSVYNETRCGPVELGLDVVNSHFIADNCVVEKYGDVWCNF